MENSDLLQPLDFEQRRRIQTMPRNLLNKNPSVKCYRNALYVLLFNTPVLLNYIDDYHSPPNCQHGGEFESCQICQFRDLARRFFAPDQERLQDWSFNDDVDRFWKAAMPGECLWPWTAQNDPVEYMDKMFNYFEFECGQAWMRDLIFPTPRKLHRCRKCAHISSKEDTSLPNVSVVLSSHHDLRQRLEHRLVERYPLHEEEEATCKKCQVRAINDMSEPLERVPPILPIQISPAPKEDYTGFYRGSLDRLDQLMAFSSHPDPVNKPHKVTYAFYRLYGVIMHTGDTHGGHYVCAVEVKRLGWLLFDDQDQADHPVLSPRSRFTTLEDIEEMQKREWRVFVLVYVKLFDIDGQVQADCEKANGDGNNNADKPGEKLANGPSSSANTGTRRGKRANRGDHNNNANGGEEKRADGSSSGPRQSKEDWKKDVDYTSRLLTSLITQLSTFSSPSASTDQNPSSKNLLLTLHCLFPNELLLALDIVDRQLIRRYHYSHHGRSEEEHEDASVKEEIYFVASTSTSTNPGTASAHRRTHEVRLDAWNCSCPAFAMRAFQQSSSPPPSSSVEDDENDKTAWFGGTLVQHCYKLHLPVCKHLLACVLAGKCGSLFGRGIVEDRVIGIEELAGLCAGF
ncbi:Ubiquitin carboxyl-terminal hydrolase 9 [Talaromyces islandicus]|uniref:ubiquitinyl hydrolase 1 n=1 Tax=Talaromyces islandicus TaxID=28573 RepID=A0A0U1LKC2_TALIS|nr:Ubiquitin carboxyl-terminal hydrolase 9 [Talaromyces islandicus]